jgi:hypothetical protein
MNRTRKYVFLLHFIVLVINKYIVYKCVYVYTVYKIKGKDKAHPRAGHEGPEGE